MVDKFEFLRDFNIEIFQYCRNAVDLINTENGYNLSLSAARIALEQLCAEENPSYYQYDSLDEKVRSFISRTNPDDNIYNALKTIKINGNEGSHGNGSTRKAKDTIELLEQVLIWYVCEYRGKKYQEADFHTSELRYVYLYCKDLKTISSKPEKAVINSKVTAEVKNDVVKQEASPITENKSVQHESVNGAKVPPIEGNSLAIDKEDKKRLKLEQKAQEEADRKAKRNAERELKKQLQKEQKAKSLEEAKRRNEEIVAKNNAKIQVQEAKKLAKERELEKKRIRDEQKELRRQKDAELIQQQNAEENFRKECEEYNKTYEDGKRALRERWENLHNKVRLDESVNTFALDKLLVSVLRYKNDELNLLNKYRTRFHEEEESLKIKNVSIISRVNTILETKEYKNIDHFEFILLTRAFSELAFKLSLEKLVWLQNQKDKVKSCQSTFSYSGISEIFLYLDKIKDDFIYRYNYMHSDSLIERMEHEALFDMCYELTNLQKQVNGHYNRINEILKSAL